jgi:hypothetical protein
MKKEKPGYSLKSVEKSEPPRGMQEGEWHKYTLVRGKLEIIGIRFDTLKAVTQHAKELAETINARNGWSCISFADSAEPKK